MLRPMGLSALQQATRRAAEEYHQDDHYDPRDPEAGPPPPPRAKAAKPDTVMPVDVASASVQPPPVTEEPRLTTPTVSATSKASAGDRFHTSIYLPRDLRRSLRQIAVDEDCKVHDLLIEAVTDLVAKRGVVKA